MSIYSHVVICIYACMYVCIFELVQIYMCMCVYARVCVCITEAAYARMNIEAARKAKGLGLDRSA